MFKFDLLKKQIKQLTQDRHESKQNQVVVSCNNVDNISKFLLDEDFEFLNLKLSYVKNIKVDELMDLTHRSFYFYSPKIMKYKKEIVMIMEKNGFVQSSTKIDGVLCLFKKNITKEKVVDGKMTRKSTVFNFFFTSKKTISVPSVYVEKSGDNILKMKKEINNIQNLQLKKLLLLKLDNPINSKRKRNLILFGDENFNLIYDVFSNELIFENKIDYSHIMYDMCKKYINISLFTFIFKNDFFEEFWFSQIPVYKQYLQRILSSQWYKQDVLTFETKQEIENIIHIVEQNPLLKIQLVGRLFQHNETGWLCADLANKFLPQKMQNNGINEYLKKLSLFVEKLGSDQFLVETCQNTNNALIANINKLGQFELKKINELVYHNSPSNHQIEKKVYSQSIEENKYKRKVLSTHNTLSRINNNLINVVSDIHIMNDDFPFENNNFNILAGDIFDTDINEKNNIIGIGVVGNHEICWFYNNVIELSRKEQTYFNESIFTYSNSQNDLFFETELIDKVIQKMNYFLPNLKILNNECCYYNGIRYVGLNILNVYLSHNREKEILEKLEEILADDHTTPTVIISHAPLFNETSLLKKQSSSYHSSYCCQEQELFSGILNKYKILGFIHGHHHIPAFSSGFKTIKTFANKQYFVICSIYSHINTGIELKKIINNLYPNIKLDNTDNKLPNK